MTQAREDFASPPSEETIQRVAQRMRERNLEGVVVGDGDQARKVVLERLPEGAEVHSGKSKTLQDAGIFDAIHDASRYDALRPRLFKMDRKNQAREIRKLIAGPDFMLGSVNAVTEEASCSWPANESDAKTALIPLARESRLWLPIAKGIAPRLSLCYACGAKWRQIYCCGLPLRYQFCQTAPDSRSCLKRGPTIAEHPVEAHIRGKMADHWVQIRAKHQHTSHTSSQSTLTHHREPLAQSKTTVINVGLFHSFLIGVGISCKQGIGVQSRQGTVAINGSCPQVIHPIKIGEML